jgi:demethylmenaquinone methyltransferase / 2-methoxy-6-polyprenyl-1,4-benzoquinol methylase
MPKHGGAPARGAASAATKRTYVQRIFSEIAPRYDLLNHLLSLNIDKRWRTGARALAWTARPTGTYLDLCAGTLDVGASSPAARVRGRVLGADFAVPMLRPARARPGATAAPVVADALALPVAEGRRVRRRHRGLRHPQRRGSRRRAARGAARAAPGARFVILEFSTPRVALVRAGYLFYFHRMCCR